MKSMLLVFAASVVGSFGAVFLKLGASRLDGSVRGFVNSRLALGVALYLGSSVFYAAGIKGGQLSVLYPMVSLGYIWTLLWSMSSLTVPRSIEKLVHCAVPSVLVSYEHVVDIDGRGVLQLLFGHHRERSREILDFGIQARARHGGRGEIPVVLRIVHFERRELDDLFVGLRDRGFGRSFLWRPNGRNRLEPSWARRAALAGRGGRTLTPSSRQARGSGGAVW